MINAMCKVLIGAMSVFVGLFIYDKYKEAKENQTQTYNDGCTWSDKVKSKVKQWLDS